MSDLPPADPAAGAPGRGAAADGAAEAGAAEAAVRVRVPGKINLHLGVGPVAADGYHPVVTVLQAVSISDEVVAEPSDAVSLALVGATGGDVPLGAANLAVRAAVALAARAGVAAGVRLSLRKTIPVAAGMAGGSADAAAALVACDALWGLRTPRTDLLDVAATLGSDVPFALLGGTALGTGRGEQLTPVLASGVYHWVFALATGGLSTPSVYREYDRVLSELPTSADLLRPAVAEPDRVLAALRAGDPEALGAALGNDLELPALRLRPELRTVLDTGLRLGALGALVSGSGPTCAFLAATADEAERLAAGMRTEQVCRRAVVATGPAPGARLVDLEEPVR